MRLEATVPRTIDVHAHLMIPDVESLVAGHPDLAVAQALDVRRNGTESLRISRTMAQERWEQLTSRDRRLADMDAAGVDLQVVSPSPSHYHYWTDEELAAQIAAAANSAIAAHIAGAPDRLLGLGMVPLQHVDVAVALLERAMDEHGLRGIMISTHAPSRNGGRTRDLSDPALDPLWSRCEALGAVVFLHPFGCTLDERLDQFYLGNVVGNPTETTVALSHLIFGGVLDRYPGLRIVAAHGGGFLPSYIGRSDHGWRVRAETHSCVDEPSSYLRRLWFDSLVHSPLVLKHLVETVGADRIMLGSDYPYDMGTDDVVGALTAAGLSAADEELVRGVNAEALYRPSP
jgi:aminocarboxymuconate-semialdehyde decarboxylase